MSAEQPVRASLRARGARRTVTSAPARPSVRAPEYWTNSFVPRFALAFSNLPPPSAIGGIRAEIQSFDEQNHPLLRLAAATKEPGQQSISILIYYVLSRVPIIT